MTSSLPPEPDPTDRPTAGAESPADPTEPTSDPGAVWASIWSEAVRAAFGTPPTPEPGDER